MLVLFCLSTPFTVYHRSHTRSVSGVGIAGVMIESNIKAGNQKLVPGKAHELVYGLSITDEVRLLIACHNKLTATIPLVEPLLYTPFITKNRFHLCGFFFQVVFVLFSLLSCFDDAADSILVSEPNPFHQSRTFLKVSTLLSILLVVPLV